jgi:hypothetical protein
MSEIGEIIALAAPHSSENAECPFCPREEPPNYTTFPGKANKSGVLADVMADPAKLAALQGGARPKQGEQHQQSPSTAQQKPTPIFTDAHEGPYSCEAHHLISGKQALEGHAFERWIVAGGTIERDTGYSVNNADNGLWAPSVPEKYKTGAKWGAMSFDQKLAIASKPMEHGQPQFHKGHHAITDPDDPDSIKHSRYDAYLKRTLKAMDDRMRGWANKCPLCDKGKKDKFQPSVRANQVLDNLSKVVRRKISPPIPQWEIFISRYALELHKPVCPHGVGDL